MNKIMRKNVIFSIEKKAFLLTKTKRDEKL